MKPNLLDAMNVSKFEKDGQSVWVKPLEDGREIVSVAIVCEETTLDLETLFERTEKNLIWLKSENAETLAKTQDTVMGQLAKGILKPYRQFSETPFYEGQAEDINPTTNVALGRYSQVRLCPADKHASLHRQYVQPLVVSETQPVVALEA